ncbi:MAG: LD-carboxypeptidase [bacterium]|nr:LD-carboxypeptidase [bacterium]
MTTAIRPPALLPGDTIGIAAPAGAFDREAFLAGAARIRAAGYRPLFRPDIFERSGPLAGPDERRAGELMALFSDGSVRAIFCARGGWGSARILPLLDPAVVRADPKIFMGYSDITALHAFLRRAAGLVTFHGPLVTEIGRMDGGDLASLFRSLGRSDPWGALPAPALEALRGGRGEGVLSGGSLSVLCATLGTPYAADTREAILLLEDRNERPHAVDRLFTQLRLAGALERARGLVLGRFVPPAGYPADAYGAEVRRIALDAVGGLCFPVLSRFPAGHAGPNRCVPLGVRAAIDGEAGTVTVLEPCLSGRGGTAA